MNLEITFYDSFMNQIDTSMGTPRRSYQEKCEAN